MDRGVVVVERLVGRHRRRCRAGRRRAPRRARRGASGASACTETHSATPSLSQTGAASSWLADGDVDELVAHEPVEVGVDAAGAAAAGSRSGLSANAGRGDGGLVGAGGHRERDAVEGLGVAAGQVVEAGEERGVGQGVDDRAASPTRCSGTRAGDVGDAALDRGDDAGGLAPVGAVEDAEHAGALAHRARARCPTAAGPPRLAASHAAVGGRADAEAAAARSGTKRNRSTVRTGTASYGVSCMVISTTPQ